MKDSDERQSSAARIASKLAAGQKSNLLLIGLLTVIATVTGCVHPNRAFVRTTPSFPGALKQAQNIGLITDAVVLYDTSTLNNRYITLQDSRIAASNLLTDTKQFLKGKGYLIGFAESPAVAGFASSKKPEKAAEKRHGEITETVFPVLMPVDASDDPKYRQALLRVLRQSFRAIGSKGDVFVEKFRSDPAIADSLL